MSGNLSVDSTMSTSGNLQVDGTGRIDSSLVVGDTVHAQALVVSGNARIAGDLKVGGKMLFSPTAGISFKTGTSTTPPVFSIGTLTATASPVTINPCLLPTMDPWFSLPMRVQIFDPVSNVALTMGSDNVQSSIDASGNNGLLINYYCGKNIYLGAGTGSGGGAGTAGASVYTGDKFYARKNVQIGAVYQAIDPNVTLNVFDINNDGVKLWPANQTVKLLHDNFDQFTFWGNGNAHLGKNVQIGFAANSAIQDANASLNINNAGLDGVKFNTYNNGAKIISIANSNLPLSPSFVVFGEGRTEINTYSTVDALTIKGYNGTTNIRTFVVKGNGQTCIGCSNAGSFMLAVEGKLGAREIKVTAVTPWPDFVFSKNYNLETLETVENYINANEHLPGIPSAKELQKENFGLNVGEMQGLQMEKIENIYLYLIEMKKELKQLKIENNNLKKRLEK